MYYLIYKITNSINGKYYIGKHQTTDINDEYYGSGVALRRAIRKHGKKSFIKEILFECSTIDEMNQRELAIVNLNMVNDPMCYNMAEGGKGGFSYINNNALNLGSNNPMVRFPKSKQKQTLAMMDTRSKNKPKYDAISKENLKKAVIKNTGCNRPEHSAIMKHKSVFIERWKNKEEMRDLLSSTFEVTSPIGKTFTTNRLQDFCEQNRLTYVSIWKSSKTNLPIKKGKSKGWICKKIQ